MWKDKITWGKETVSGFEFSISREVCVWNGTAENKISLQSWKEKWKYFFPSPFLFFVNTLITSIFNWILCSFWQGKGISSYLSMIGVNSFFKDSPPPKDPKLSLVERVAWTWGSKCCQLRPQYSPSNRSSNPVPALQWESASLRCSLAQLPPSLPIAKSQSCFGKGSSGIGISLLASFILAKRHSWLH